VRCLPHNSEFTPLLNNKDSAMIMQSMKLPRETRVASTSVALATEINTAISWHRLRQNAALLW
jgi:hypothetical protein